jgi:hypothetical protein
MLVGGYKFGIAGGYSRHMKESIIIEIVAISGLMAQVKTNTQTDDR